MSPPTTYVLRVISFFQGLFFSHRRKNSRLSAVGKACSSLGSHGVVDQLLVRGDLLNIHSRSALANPIRLLSLFVSLSQARMRVNSGSSLTFLEKFVESGQEIRRYKSVVTFPSVHTRYLRHDQLDPAVCGSNPENMPTRVRTTPDADLIFIHVRP